jgi:hypothetical protein
MSNGFHDPFSASQEEKYEVGSGFAGSRSKSIFKSSVKPGQMTGGVFIIFFRIFFRADIRPVP